MKTAATFCLKSMELDLHLGRSCQSSRSSCAAIARICTRLAGGSNTAVGVWIGQLASGSAVPHENKTTTVRKDNHMNQDQASGKWEQLKGRAKRAEEQTSELQS